jgi:hypothetical protein
MSEFAQPLRNWSLETAPMDMFQCPRICTMVPIPLLRCIQVDVSMESYLECVDYVFRKRQWILPCFEVGGGRDGSGMYCLG